LTIGVTSCATVTAADAVVAEVHSGMPVVPSNEFPQRLRGAPIGGGRQPLEGDETPSLVRALPYMNDWRQRRRSPMPDLKAQTITLHEGDKTALQYLGAAVVLQWSSLPDDVRTALLRQADAVGGLPLVSDLHEQIQALIRRVRTD
jgi:hypothetical protein